AGPDREDHAPVEQLADDAAECQRLAFAAPPAPFRLALAPLRPAARHRLVLDVNRIERPELRLDAAALAAAPRFRRPALAGPAARLPGNRADAVIRRNLKIHEQGPGMLLAHGHVQPVRLGPVDAPDGKPTVTRAAAPKPWP